jgi:hypothetical protein
MTRWNQQGNDSSKAKVGKGKCAWGYTSVSNSPAACNAYPSKSNAPKPKPSPILIIILDRPAAIPPPLAMMMCARSWYRLAEMKAGATMIRVLEVM